MLERLEFHCTVTANYVSRLDGHRHHLPLFLRRLRQERWCEETLLHERWTDGEYLAIRLCNKRSFSKALLYFLLGSITRKMAL
jgi:hypothetical protein